jgi:septum formation protein
MTPPETPPVVLASASTIRVTLLRQAGVPVEVMPAEIDEASVKDALRSQGASADDCALALAEHKAVAISRARPDALVIGADQMLDCDGVWFDKPPDRDRAAAQLRALSGKTHELVSAAVVVRDGARQWQHVERARLTMRQLNDAFIASYLDAVGEAALRSVGCYQLEGRGIQLFAHVDGDHFTILGLPLLPLLGCLRHHGVVPA